jgi:hypothetical protein
MSDFSKIIYECSEAIKLGKTYLSQGSVPEDQVNGLKSLILFSSLRKTIAYYSSVASKETVTQSLLDTITAFEEGFKWEGFEKSYGMYDQIIWILSLGILCEISDDDFKRIIAVLKRDNAKDRLIKTLVNYRLPNEFEGSSYIQKSPYADLDMLVTGQNKSTSFIKNYLDKKWYQGHDDAPWYDSHKRTKVNTYFGYWAWEVGALAKIYNINDKDLENQKYYPYRAVHW